MVIHLKDFPEIAALWNNLGWVCFEKGKYDKAIEYFEKSLECLKRVGLLHHAATVEKNLEALHKHINEDKK